MKRSTKQCFGLLFISMGLEHVIPTWLLFVNATAMIDRWQRTSQFYIPKVVFCSMMS